MFRPLALYGTLLFCGLTAEVAEAASHEKGATAARHYELSNTSWQALSVESLAGATGWATAWLVTGGARESCRWCESNRFDESARSALRASDPRAPAFVSHALSVGAVPVLTLTGLIVPAYEDGESHRGLEDSWVVVNTFLITAAVADLTKNLVARERPAFHHHAEGEMEYSSTPSEGNKSFFSLDTAWAFAIASSGATLAHLHGYSSANYIAIGGGLLAASAGTLRVVGDAHWATDVLTGAAVGTAIGIAVPVLFHGRRPTEQATATVSPLQGGSLVSFSGRF